MTVMKLSLGYIIVFPFPDYIVFLYNSRYNYLVRKC